MPKPTFYQLLSGGMTSKEHREKSMVENVKRRQSEKLKEKPNLDIHAGLDLLGMTPGFGAAPDLLNATLHAVKGDRVKSLSSLASALPLAGQVATLQRMGRIGQLTDDESDK
tara:strand:- start:69 stop:404 length:336 start_codon:yes stop_codon:yes gene_type:complete